MGGHRPAPFQLTLFDDNIQWVPVVKYLGLHIDSRLTFKKHIDYLSEKFWGKISLAISLVGRRSPLSLENKVILYKQILRPVITYGSPVWGATAATHMKKIQVMQNKILRVMTNAPGYVRNDVIHNDLQMAQLSLMVHPFGEPQPPPTFNAKQNKYNAPGYVRNDVIQTIYKWSRFLNTSLNSLEMSLNLSNLTTIQLSKHKHCLRILILKLNIHTLRRSGETRFAPP
ncbi:probable RNA-directed DNA polymerase from transposon X-element [Trichonephila clavipes]|nr:probable RNA-directed DNA polymerase from transposon X-element [Trichonephila clavipes]